MVEIRRVLSDASVPDIIRAVNLALDLVQGNTGGRFYFQNDDGIERNIRGGAQISTGNFAVKIRSGAGNHLDVRDSGDLASRLRVTDAQVLMSVNDIQIIGTTPRITAELSNATLANRLLFQSYIVNGDSTVGVIPNGTSTTAGWVAYNNATPASATGAAVIRATSSAVEIRADNPSGAGALPLDFYTSTGKQITIAAATGIATFTAAPIVPTLTPPTANGQVTAGGLIKAWARVVGATGAISQSQNIASVTRNLAGDYSVVIDRDFAAATYGGVIGIENGTQLTSRVNSQIAGSCDVHIESMVGVKTDPTAFTVVFLGTLS